MDPDLAGCVAVVTGASGGIGLAVTRALVAGGATVVAGARKPTAELDELEGVTTVPGDLTTSSGATDLVAAALEHGRLDILVHNVGAVTPRTNGFLMVTDEQWQSTLELNLLSAVRTVRAALPPMLTAGRGSIVVTSSVNAVLPDPTVIDYSAAKAALTNLCKSLSKEVGPRGVRVNTVSPGPVATQLWLGEGGVASTLAQAGGVRPEQVADEAAGQSVT
ncbi:MAG: SDR family NAD(P)-dependent oxidoreductase, partial [Nocardioides sp.]|nr:SDR family NAD(P)-dependent oxidoreductase [Nocardioides sp.]